MEGALTIGREVGISYLTAGLGTIAECSRIGAGLSALTRGALVAREAYEGAENFGQALAAVDQGIVQGSHWSMRDVLRNPFLAFEQA